MGLEYVKKRDGTTVEFDSEKIRKAVLKAASAVELENEAIGEEITQEVISYLKIFFGDKGIPEVEQIQDLVEKVLIEKGYAEVAKAYILYREQHKKIRDTQKMFNDAIKTMNNYLELEDWKVRENSNMSYSLQGLNNFISSEVTSQYWLQEIYPDQAGEKHLSGDFHIHDLGNLSVYCCGWDLEDFLRTGFRGVPTKIESDPPKHLKTALGQMVNFFFTLQGEAAGAMAFSNFDTLLAPFIAYDNLDYKEVKQAMQEFLFNMNVPTRVGFQTPFTNITMDLTVPDHFKDQPVIIGGEMKDRTYGEFQEEMDLINKAFAEVMMAGDSKGRVFSFPIPTYNITPDFDWDNPVLNPVWEMTAKYGIPYFCLYEKTKIITNNGIKEIGNLEIDNDKVLGEDGKFYSINHYIKNTHSEYIKIITENRKTIKCSNNHKFPTQNGIKKAKNLTIDDQLKEFNKKIIFENGFELSYQNQSFFNIYNKTGENIKFSIIDEKNKDQFYFLKPTTRKFKKLKEFTFEKNRFQTTLKEIKIPQSLDEDIFEIIGQLLGDGYLPKNKNNISLVSNDDEIINYFSQTVKSKFDLEIPLYQAGNSETCKEANINSKMFNEYLRHIGLKFGRDNEKEIPSIIYHRTEKEIGALLRGIFDTDGSISINNGGNPIISLTLKNRKIMQQILELLMFLGITPYYKNKKNKYGIIRIHGSKNINLFKEKINFRIKRKADKLKIKQSNKPNLGDKILTKEQSLQEFGKDHRRYKENDTFRVKKSADGIYLFVEDIIENNNYVSIKSLRRENKKINTVDINVNNESHLFLLENEIISHNSNFVNSDMDPEDARSMCLYPEETMMIKVEDDIKKCTIEEIFEDYKGEKLDEEWYLIDKSIETLSLNPDNGKLEWAKINKFLKIRDNKIVKITAKDGKTMRVSADHLVGVYKENNIHTIKAKNLNKNDLLLILKNSEQFNKDIKSVSSLLLFDHDEYTNEKKNFTDRKDIAVKVSTKEKLEKNEIAKKADFTVIEIKNIEKEELDYQQVFYDIELNKNHYFVHSDGNITHNCCRLRLDNRELRKRGGGLFGANPMTGSIGVVTLNMPRIGYLADDKEDYMNRVYELMDIAKESLEIKRKVLENLTEQGLYPYSKFYLRNIKKRFDEYWKNHFNTIGINGMNESLENFMGENITEEEAHKFTIEVMEKMKSRMKEYQEDTGNLYNLEATPAESTSYRLARLDKERFGNDIIAANESRVKENDAEPYYTNSTHLPVGYTDDIFDALEIQDDFQIEFTGGTVFHGFLGERLNGIESTKKLVKRIAANFKLPYYTITPTFSICPVHGYLPGEHKYCPKCEAEERAKTSGQ